MDTTSTLKLWYPSRVKLDLTFNMLTLVSNRSYAKPISNQIQLVNYSLNDPESWEIIKLIQDSHVLSIVQLDNFEPSIIAKFAINLAQAFNKYYAHTRILDESPRT